MEADPLAIGRRAEAALRKVVAEIGPRPAGSPAERAALDFVRGQVEAQGYSTELREFPCPSIPAYLPYFAIPGVIFLAAALLLPIFPWLALAVPIMVVALPELSDAIIRRLPSRGSSANLLALPEGIASIQELGLLFCAHVDTARAIPVGGKFVASVRRQVFPILQRMATILLLLGAVVVIGFPFPQPLYLAAVSITGLAAVGLLALDLYDQLGTRGQHTVGANDNASGLAVLLELARLLPAGSRVGLLFTGAEEIGLLGARVFAKQYEGIQPLPPVVSVDMVGVGDKLRIITESRGIRITETNGEINALLARIDPAAVRHTALRRTGDFVPFLKAGFPATAVETSGTPAFWRAYHTLEDDLRHIDPVRLGEVTWTLARLAEEMAREKTPPA